MGQALRRVSGRVRPSAFSPAQAKKATEPLPMTGTAAAAPQDRVGVPDSDVSSSSKDVHDTELDDKDPSYDQMLNNMVGRITSKPGGKLEMGEASIVERYGRPLPKLRSSNEDAPSGSQRRPLPAGTLKIEQIHQIIQLHEGKSDCQDSKMGIKEISERFKVDPDLVKKIVNSLSLPQEENSNNNKSEEK